MSDTLNQEQHLWVSNFFIQFIEKSVLKKPNLKGKTRYLCISNFFFAIPDAEQEQPAAGREVQHLPGAAPAGKRLHHHLLPHGAQQVRLPAQLLPLAVQDLQPQQQQLRHAPSSGSPDPASPPHTSMLPPRWCRSGKLAVLLDVKMLQMEPGCGQRGRPVFRCCRGEPAGGALLSYKGRLLAAAAETDDAVAFLLPISPR